MSRWFRFYDDAVNDPKVQRLEPALFKAWVNLLCLASKNEGWLPPLDDVAFSLRLSEEEAGQMVDALISSGLVDEIDGKCAPHNWHERQYKSDSSAERVKRFRDKKRNDIKAPDVTKCNVTRSVSVTVQNRADTDTDTEQKERESVRAKRASRLPDDWLPSEADKLFALGQGMSIEGTRIEAIKFRNYWTAKGGQGAAKTNWARTWQNWVLNSNGASHGTAKPKTGGSQTGGSLIAAIDRQLAALQAQDGTDLEMPKGPVLRISNGPVR